MVTPGYLDRALNAYHRHKRLIRPTNHGFVLDIGSRDGDDAETIARAIGTSFFDVYCVDANPIAIDIIRSRHMGFNVIQSAVAEYDGTAEFNIMTDTTQMDRFGISSLRDRSDLNYDDRIKVGVITLDSLFKKIAPYPTTQINFMKIDVEGNTYDVLCGAKNALKKTRFIQLEAEHRQFWTGQYLFYDVAQLLNDAGFAMVDFTMTWKDQSDSCWINLGE